MSLEALERSAISRHIEQTKIRLGQQQAANSSPSIFSAQQKPYSDIQVIDTQTPRVSLTNDFETNMKKLLANVEDKHKPRILSIIKELKNKHPEIYEDLINEVDCILVTKGLYDKTTAGENAAGVYHGMSNIIMLDERYLSKAILVHELGHAVDFRNNGTHNTSYSSGKIRESFYEELAAYQAAGGKAYGANNTSAPYCTANEKEMFAEVYRWMTMPEYRKDAKEIAYKNFPKTVAMIEKYIKEELRKKSPSERKASNTVSVTAEGFNDSNKKTAILTEIMRDGSTQITEYNKKDGSRKETISYPQESSHYLKISRSFDAQNTIKEEIRERSDKSIQTITYDDKGNIQKSIVIYPKNHPTNIKLTDFGDTKILELKDGSTEVTIRDGYTTTITKYSPNDDKVIREERILEMGKLRSTKTYNKDGTIVQIDYDRDEISQKIITQKDGSSISTYYFGDGYYMETIKDPNNTEVQEQVYSYNQDGIKINELLRLKDGSSMSKYYDEGTGTRLIKEENTTPDGQCLTIEYNEKGEKHLETIDVKGYIERERYYENNYLVKEIIYKEDGSTEEIFYNEDGSVKTTPKD